MSTDNYSSPYFYKRGGSNRLGLSWALHGASLVSLSPSTRLSKLSRESIRCLTASSNSRRLKLGFAVSVLAPHELEPPPCLFPHDSGK